MLECLSNKKPRMRTLLPQLVSAALMAVAVDASAMGFGRVLSRTTLGEPLNMAIALRLDAGETLQDDCVSAQVMSGDARITPGDVRVRVTGGGDERILRISTRPAIDEPVVTVTVAVGCPPQLTRQFVALADPPGFQPAQTAAAPTPSAPPAPLIDAPPRAAAPSPAPSVEAPAAPLRSRPPAPRRAESTVAPQRRVATAPTTPARPRPRAAEATPRLRLDMSEPARPASAVQPPPAATQPLVAAAPPVVAAPLAAPASVAVVPPAASADDARVRALEEELARLRADAKAQRDALNAVQSQLAQTRAAAGGDLSRWMPWLLGLLLALLVGLIYLAARVQSLARERAAGWAAERGDSSLAPEADSRPAVWTPAAVPAAVEVTEHDSTQTPPLPDTMPLEQPPAVPALRREVSIEEQVDLEQQADFFTALGQDDQAVDLLVTHLRATGGTNPMPYLKLMEIHRRRGEHDAYERTRERFNLRFNAVAPDWDSDPKGGRALEDYPQVLARLEQAWWQPLDAMTELETLLFQRGPTAERFDMAAYQEIVMLYRMAREQRLAEEQGTGSQVDVLLPIDSGRGDEAVSVRHVDIMPTTTSPPAIDIELPGPFELDLPRDDDKPRR
jgi:pilus assembly protein FimV